MNKKLIVYIVAALAGILILAGGYWGFLFASTPAHLRYPQFEHYHFRTQILVSGKAVDFSEDKFQQAYDASSCSVEVSGTPIDFHDNADQMTHIHWDGITGGEFLKYYGWNFIGGADDSMGWRYDQGIMTNLTMKMPNIPTFGKHLPAIPDGVNFYVYTGDEKGYQKKNWNDFLNQNLEDFFGKQSNIKQNEQSFRWDSWLFKNALAHGGVDDGHDQELSEADLTRINNLIGNVVIFVQDSEPSDKQIKERFGNLAPLHESTCGG